MSGRGLPHLTGLTVSLQAALQELWLFLGCSAKAQRQWPSREPARARGLQCGPTGALYPALRRGAFKGQSTS